MGLEKTGLINLSVSSKFSLIISDNPRFSLAALKTLLFARERGGTGSCADGYHTADNNVHNNSDKGWNLPTKSSVPKPVPSSPWPSRLPPRARSHSGFTPTPIFQWKINDFSFTFRLSIPATQAEQKKFCSSHIEFTLIFHWFFTEFSLNFSSQRKRRSVNAALPLIYRVRQRECPSPSTIP